MTSAPVWAILVPQTKRRLATLTSPRRDQDGWRILVADIVAQSLLAVKVGGFFAVGDTERIGARRKG